MSSKTPIHPVHKLPNQSRNSSTLPLQTPTHALATSPIASTSRRRTATHALTTSTPAPISQSFPAVTLARRPSQTATPTTTPEIAQHASQFFHVTRTAPPRRKCSASRSISQYRCSH